MWSRKPNEEWKDIPDPEPLTPQEKRALGGSLQRAYDDFFEAKAYVYPTADMLKNRLSDIERNRRYFAEAQVHHDKTHENSAISILSSDPNPLEKREIEFGRCQEFYDRYLEAKAAGNKALQDKLHLALWHELLLSNGINDPYGEGYAAEADGITSTPAPPKPAQIIEEPAAIVEPVASVPDPVATPAELTDEEEAARRRFKLDYPFTVDELKKRYMILQGRVLPQLSGQVDADYTILLPLAA